MSKRGFGELESQILYILRSGERKTVKEVHQALGGADNYNTVMTVMTRLAQKKQLARVRIGLHYEYWIVHPKPSETTSILEKFKQKFFGVKTTALVSHLIESADDLTDEDLAEMERLDKKIRASKK